MARAVESVAAVENGLVDVLVSRLDGMAWVDDFSAPIVKLIGAAEVLGALGLILPVLTGIAPTLSSIAGIALAVVMIGAAVVHVRCTEPVVPPLVLTVRALAATVLGFIVIS
jgi:hypothetical protein